MGTQPFGVLFDTLANEKPTAPAITVGDTTLTRQELAKSANRLAHWCAANGAKAGRIVVVALPNGISLVETVVAVWKTGATPLVVPSKMPGPELDAVLQLADPALVIRTGGLPTGTALAAWSDEALPPAVPRWWRASVTGGSTGRPKLILSSRPGTADPAERTLYLRQGGCTVIPGPLYHGAPFLFAFFSLFRGRHLVLLERFSPEATLEAISRHRGDYTLLVPTMMSRVWKLPQATKAAADLSSLEVMLHLGAACPPWLKQAWIDWIGAEHVYELYAGTEGQAMTWIRGDEWLAHPGSVGRAVGGASMRAFGPDGQALPPGEVGEIFMKPPSGAAPTYEYVGAEVRSQDGWESLGDMGYVDAGGYVYVVDRRTDMIVSGGANIYPAEVEQVIDEHPRVITSAVVGLPDDDLGRRVHAIVEIRPPLEAEELAAFVSQRLVRYKVPRSFELTTSPLRDEAGKVRRSALVAQRTGLSARDAQQAGPPAGDQQRPASPHI